MQSLICDTAAATARIDSLFGVTAFSRRRPRPVRQTAKPGFPQFPASAGVVRNFFPAWRRLRPAVISPR